jgi:hypothetical protein
MTGYAGAGYAAADFAESCCAANGFVGLHVNFWIFSGPFSALITPTWEITSDVSASSRSYDSSGPIARQGCEAGTTVTIYTSGENEPSCR